MTQASYVIPCDVWQHIDIPLPTRNEFLRVGYGGTQRGRFWEPSGPRDERDYIHIAHFTHYNVEYSRVLMVQPFYQYIVDIGHGYVLVPSKEKMPIPHRPDWSRCATWEVRKFVAEEWEKTVPIKQAIELLQQEREKAA